MSEKRALTKFLRCVDWSDAQVSIIYTYIDFIVWASEGRE